MQERFSARNNSLDLLRVISMIMIILLHINTHGKVLDNTDTFVFYSSRFILSFSIVAVNVFVLISGYFLTSGKFRLSKLLTLCAEVWFYSVCIYLVLVVISYKEFKLEEFIPVFFPISFKQYWFISAYIIMYILSPFLNYALTNCPKNLHKICIFVLVLLSSVWHDLIPGSDTLLLNDGFSFFWFIVLYVIASYIRKYGIRIKRPFIIYIICTLLTFILNIGISRIRDSFPLVRTFIKDGYFFSYCSILNLIASIGLFVVFLRKDMGCNNKVLSFITPLTFGVYLLHDNNYLRDLIWQKIFRFNEIYNPVLLIISVFLSAFFLFLLSIFMDYWRSLLFKLVFNKKTTNIIDRNFEKTLNTFKNSTE